MDSASLHHHLVGSSSPATPSSTYGVADNHAWTPPLIFTRNTSNFSSNLPEPISNPREARHEDGTRVPHLSNSMIQDLNFQWTPNHGPHDQSIEQLKNEYKEWNYDLSEKLMLKTLTSSYRNAHHFAAEQVYPYNHHGLSSRRGFSQIYPSVNISKLNQSSSAISSSIMDMNSKPLDLLASGRLSGSSCEHPGVDHGFETFRGKQADLRPSCSTGSTSLISSKSVAVEAKRPIERKVAQQGRSASKKPRLETCPNPSPPIKARKEKLGDRIAALQQLVSPFGKTDTASVLMEATGYIKFLTNQVEALSIPYMKSSHNNTSRSGSGESREENGNGETKEDLTSRGLSLVPLSCMSYVTGEGSGGGIWPPSNFG